MIKQNWTDAAERRLQRFLPLIERWNPHPDVVTGLGVLLSLVGAWQFAQGNFRVAALWVIAGGLCDLFDGVIARAQGRATAFGGLLDSTGDRVVDIGLLLGISHYYATGDRTGWALVAYLALVGSVLVSYVKARGEAEVADLGVGLLERGERIGLLVTGAILGLMPLALCAVALGSWFTAFQRIMLAREKMAAAQASRSADALEDLPHE